MYVKNMLNNDMVYGYVILESHGPAMYHFHMSK